MENHVSNVHTQAHLFRGTMRLRPFAQNAKRIFSEANKRTKQTHKPRMDNCASFGSNCKTTPSLGHWARARSRCEPSSTCVFWRAVPEASEIMAKAWPCRPRLPICRDRCLKEAGENTEDIHPSATQNVSNGKTAYDTQKSNPTARQSSLPGPFLRRVPGRQRFNLCPQWGRDVENLRCQLDTSVLLCVSSEHLNNVRRGDRQKHLWASV